ncbi:MAG: hypothetical protein JWP57_2460 [Spirosoma sp.]|nr:hypothetical protein [Spirosoma sp.]
MITHLPLYVSLVFSLTTLLTVWLYYRATQQSTTTLIVLLSWMALQGVLGLTGFYQVTNTVPPRFPALIGPPLLLIGGLLLTQQGRRYINTLRLDRLTLLHVVRIPVEVVLFWLFVGKLVPQAMTFEGRNFDILSGITAPIIYYVGFVKRQLPHNLLFAWNLVCLGLLINIVLTAALAAPTPFQQIAFEQPNRGILYFPFIWLPSVVVPIVLIAHVAALRQLTRKQQ